MEIMRKSVYSFSFLDTCFIRACAFSHNVFDLLAYRVLGDTSNENERADFTNIRINGEKQARLLSKKEEVTLEDIYDYCHFEGITFVPKTQIAAYEIEVEREQLLPVYSVLEQVKELHKKGETIYFISDTYLPERFIKDLLSMHGFWREGDKLYISCSYNATKGTGSLYKIVAEQNNLSLKKWFHYGNSRYSDYEIPKKIGISATLIKHTFSYYEQFILNQDYFSAFFLNQHLAGISKAVRLSFPCEIKYGFAADLVAPLYVSFVCHILQDAEKKGIKKLFFLARDGYILYKIAEHLLCKFSNVEIRYIYVSRSSLYLPGLPSITSHYLKSLSKTQFHFTNEDQLDILANFISPKVHKMIENLSLNREINGVQTSLDLFNNPAVISILAKYHNEQRGLILKYFRQEGLANKNDKTAIVDVAGSRFCHQIINRILKESGYPLTEGYYLMVTDKRKNISEAGTYDALFYGERMNLNNSLAYVRELGNFFEQYCSISPHQRTIYYEEINSLVQPVFEEGTCKKYAENIVQCHESIVELFAKQFINNKMYFYTSSLLMLSIKIISDFSKKPNYKYLKALQYIEVNNKVDKYVWLIKRISLKDIGRNSIDWKRGALFLTLRPLLSANTINGLYAKIKKMCHKS